MCLPLGNCNGQLKSQSLCKFCVPCAIRVCGLKALMQLFALGWTNPPLSLLACCGIFRNVSKNMSSSWCQNQDELIHVIWPEVFCGLKPIKTTLQEKNNSTALPSPSLLYPPVNAGLLTYLPNGLAVLVLRQKLLLCLEFYCSASSHNFFCYSKNKIFQLLAYCTADYPRWAPERFVLLALAVARSKYCSIIFLLCSLRAIECLSCQKQTENVCYPLPLGFLFLAVLSQCCSRVSCAWSPFVVVVSVLPRLQEQGSLSAQVQRLCWEQDIAGAAVHLLIMDFFPWLQLYVRGRQVELKQRCVYLVPGTAIVRGDLSCACQGWVAGVQSVLSWEWG